MINFTKCCVYLCHHIPVINNPEYMTSIEISLEVIFGLRFHNLLYKLINCVNRFVS